MSVVLELSYAVWQELMSMVMMAALDVKLVHWSAPEPGDCGSSIYGYRTGCFFSPVKSNLLIWRGNFYPRNYYMVSYESLNWGILIFNMNWTLRHTAISIKLLLCVSKNKQDFKICVTFISSYTMTIAKYSFL